MEFAMCKDVDPEKTPKTSEAQSAPAPQTVKGKPSPSSSEKEVEEKKFTLDVSKRFQVPPIEPRRIGGFTLWPPKKD